MTESATVKEPSWVQRPNFPNLTVDLTNRAFTQLQKIEFPKDSVFRRTETPVLDEAETEASKRRKTTGDTEPRIETDQSESSLPPHKLNFLKAVYEVFRSDPRSVYRKAKTPDRLFFTEIDGIKVTAWFDDGEDPIRCEVLRFQVPREDQTADEE